MSFWVAVGKSIRPRWREMVGRYQAGVRNEISKVYGSHGSKSRCKSMKISYNCNMKYFSNIAAISELSESEGVFTTA